MHTILVAEDDIHIANLIEITLKEAGYDVLKAKNGLEALQYYENYKISLLLIDIVMPGLDGFNLLGQIRKTSTVPAVFITSRDQEIDYVMGLGLGADDYLAKPFSMPTLKAKVDAIIRRCYSYQDNTLKKSEKLVNGPLSIDLIAYTCRIGQYEVDLNAKEIKLLIFFCRHLNQVFTARQLYQAVWDDGFLYDENTIRVHISHLRQKVDPDKVMLKTIRGIGYKMVEVKV